MEWIINQLRDHPELAIFLTLFAGFWLGRFKIGKFSLGTVTSVLLVGVLVGQLNISVDGPMKAVFFLLFLFAVGYKVGPQFFPRLGGHLVDGQHVGALGDLNVGFHGGSSSSFGFHNNTHNS